MGCPTSKPIQPDSRSCLRHLATDPALPSCAVWYNASLPLPEPRHAALHTCCAVAGGSTTNGKDAKGCSPSFCHAMNTSLISGMANCLFDKNPNWGFFRDGFEFGCEQDLTSMLNQLGNESVGGEEAIKSMSGTGRKGVNRAMLMLVGSGVVLAVAVAAL